MQSKRVQILDAASRLISERGYSQTSVDDVIKASGLCGKSHFYHYYKSKESLGYAILDKELERLTERGLAILRETNIDALERLGLFIDTLVVSQAERGCKGGSCLGMLAAELADSHEGFRQRIDEVFLGWETHIESLLEEAQPHLREDVDTKRLARFVIATLEGAVLMSRVKRDVAVLQGIAADLKRFIEMHAETSRAHR
jgi:TetR/AcrR family transcriptional regulator, transcriptional repressor for nem operon